MASEGLRSAYEALPRNTRGNRLALKWDNRDCIFDHRIGRRIGRAGGFALIESVRRAKQARDIFRGAAIAAE
jgi:hypothetical protein